MKIGGEPGNTIKNAVKFRNYSIETFPRVYRLTQSIINTVCLGVLKEDNFEFAK